MNLLRLLLDVEYVAVDTADYEMRRAVSGLPVGGQRLVSGKGGMQAQRRCGIPNKMIKDKKAKIKRKTRRAV